MRKCTECTANRYRVIRGRKIDLGLWAPLAGAIAGSAACLAVALVCPEPAVRADPRMRIVVALKWSAFAFLMAFWVMDPWVHYHPVAAEARYNQPKRVLGQFLLRAVVTGVVVGLLSIGLEDLLLR